ncbi:MAG: glycosyltransferase, partial [Solirubrobacterales bacterium]
GYHGRSREQVAAICRDADLMVNLSGGCWFPRPEYERLPKIFIDTDPGFTQQAIVDAGDGWYRDFFAGHDTLYTFALGIEEEECTLPETGFRWHPTVQPVELDFWPWTPVPVDAPFSTILSWTTDSFPGMGKGKGEEMLRMIGLPERSEERIQLAVAGQPPTQLLAEHGWELSDAVEATIDADAYRRFIQASKAELGFAKAMYVETRSGWFSDRTQCYLASGRPALVRETGFSSVIPIGEGLLAFEDVEGILEGIERIGGDYERHSRRARELASEHFAAGKVLSALLETAGIE